MFDTRAIQENFGRIAQAYDEAAHLQRSVREHCIALAKPLWAGREHILDAGCGTGALREDVSSRKLSWRICGLDISAGMCGVAIKRNPHTVSADAAAMPFHNQTFDGIFSSLMLQWASYPQGVFNDMARVLRPGGHVVLATLASGTLHELRQSFAAFDHTPHVSTFLEPHHILEYAGTSGFSLVSARQVAVVEYYPDAIAIMRALQAIGATNKNSSRRRGLMTPGQFARMEKYYESFRQPQGLPVTWQVLYMVLGKP